MITWIPDMETMTRYRQGLIRVFQPYEDLVITMSSERCNWPLIQQEEVADIGALLDLPWIPLGEVIDIPEDDIPMFMEQLRNPVGALDHLRPQLVYEGVPQMRLVSKPSKQVSLPLPIHIVKLLLERAEQENATCSITEEPLTVGSASVTSCGHLFNTVAIQRWLSTGKGCPECRQPCVV